MNRDPRIDRLTDQVLNAMKLQGKEFGKEVANELDNAKNILHKLEKDRDEEILAVREGVKSIWGTEVLKGLK